MITALFLGLVIGSVAPGPRDTETPVAACDTTRVAPVAFLRGDWHVRSDEPARTPPRQRHGTATVTIIAGGCALHEALRLADGYEETRLLAFDERSGGWQLAIVDSDHGNIVSMRGHAVEDGLDFISTHQRPSGLLIDRVAIRGTATGWLMRTETARGYGAPWRVLQEIHYTRVR